MQPILSVARRNYKLARSYYIYKLHRNLKRFKKPPVIIYQMGKVGSSTIAQSIKAYNVNMPVYHVHYLSKSRVNQLEKERQKYFKTTKENLLRRSWKYQHLRKELHDKPTGKKWKIISLTREPIARNISAFFENLEFKSTGENQCYLVKSDYYRINAIRVNLATIDNLIALFFDRFYHDSPLTFFDRELKKVFEIDVYASPFPKSKGYKIYEGEKADVLILKLENLNQCSHPAFREFFNIEKIDLIGSNIGSEKDYAPLYSKFKDDIRFPESYINKMYQSKYMQHFYSDFEIEELRAKWLRVDESVGNIVT